MASIHPTAIVSSTARLGEDVTIGPFCIIEDDVEIGAGCTLASHVVLKRGTRLGRHNQICEGAVLGGRPQHTRAGNEVGGLVLGDHNTIREMATLHCGLAPDNWTVVGSHNLLMVGSHLGHDARIGDHNIVANAALLAGHVEVEHHVYISGAVVVHQFCRIGQNVMLGGQSHVTQDVPPFVTIDGKSHGVVGLNIVGLRRRGFTTEELRQLKEAYRIIYRSGLAWNEVLQTLQERFPDGPASQLHTFLVSGNRGFVQERRAPRMATLKISSAATPEEQQEIRKAG